MSDLAEATTLVYEALQSLEAPDRRRVLAAAQALLGEDPAYVVPSGLLQAAAARAFGREFEAGAVTEPRKPVPVPVERAATGVTSPKGPKEAQSLQPILDDLRKNPWDTTKGISIATGRSPSTLQCQLKKLLDQGKIEVRHNGRINQYRLSPTFLAQYPTGQQ